MYSCDMTNEYYAWLLDFINLSDKFNGKTHERTIGILNNREFVWSVNNDDNRAYDGLDLRLLFAYEYEYPLDFWYGYLPDYCSVLEMMVALARRCEIEIMRDPDYGDRTAVWFWDMMKNLGLDYYNNSVYDENPVKCRAEIEKILDIFLGRKYGRDGFGNIFTTKNPKIRMNVTEIWYQLQFYVEENY